MIMEQQPFKKLDQLPIIICIQCQHGVWPKEIQKHLVGSHHQFAPSKAKELAEAVLA